MYAVTKEQGSEAMFTRAIEQTPCDGAYPFVHHLLPWEVRPRAGSDHGSASLVTRVHPSTLQQGIMLALGGR